MRRMSVIAAVASLIASLLGAAGAAGADHRWARGGREGAVTHTLENGLTVVLTPGDAGELVSAVLLFKIGERQDPPGKSGLAHFLEHILATAGTDRAPARSASQMMQSHPKGWNAQTFTDHTVLGGVVTTEQLDAELVDLAARLRALKIEASDLDREIPRMADELRNMYGGMPGLAAMNLARQQVSPLPEGAQAGGHIEMIRAITIDELKDRKEHLYGPSNAVLSIAGRFNADQVMARIRELFGPIPRCDAAPPPRPAAPSAAAGVKEVTVRPIAGQSSDPQVAVAYPAIPPGDADYPAYLLLLGALNNAAIKENFFNAPFPPPLMAVVLDVSAPIIVRRSRAEALKLSGGDSPDPATRVEAWVAGALTMSDDQLAAARRMFLMSQGWMIGADAGSPMILSANPYGIAYSKARTAWFAVDGASLRAQIDAVDAAACARVAARVFSPAAARAVIVTPAVADKAPPAP